MHIVHAIEHKEWPVSINFTAGDEIDMEKEQSEIITINTDHGISRHIPTLGTSISATPINIGNINNSGHGNLGGNINSNVNNNNSSANKKRKRHIAIDVETERGKNKHFNVLYEHFM